MDVNHRAWWTIPLRESGNVVSEGGVVNLENQDPEESSGLIAGVRFELRVDLDDKCGGNDGKETSLTPDERTFSGV